jgi:hypothetical protein
MKDLTQTDAEDVPLVMEGKYKLVPQRFTVIDKAAGLHRPRAKLEVTRRRISQPNRLPGKFCAVASVLFCRLADGWTLFPHRSGYGRV